MRGLLALAAAWLCGCGSPLEFNDNPDMTATEMAGRATLVFTGVIQSQKLINWPWNPVPGDRSGYWKVAQRRVTVEAVALGREPRKEVDIYEVYWTGGATGNWNFTQNGGRYLFLVRKEGNRYHVVRDWWRSIFSVSSGYHSRFPGEPSVDLLERVGLLQYWLGPGWSPAVFRYPGGLGSAIGAWRGARLLRGFLAHPDARVRSFACEALVLSFEAQDECYERELHTGRETVSDPVQIGRQWKLSRRFEDRALAELAREVKRARISSISDELRLLTTINNHTLRARICAQFQSEFPTETDHGCPAGQPPPASYVTEAGEIRLRPGETPRWPVL